MKITAIRADKINWFYVLGSQCQIWRINMQHRLEKFQHNEKGFTLLELLVSVVLLTIVVGALLSMFVTSTKTNITSAEVVDEGYMAQKHMEKIYSLGKDKSVSEIADHLLGKGYNSLIDHDYAYFRVRDGEYYIETELFYGIYDAINEDLCKVVVSVYNDSTYSDYSDPLTSMQGIYLIKE